MGAEDLPAVPKRRAYVLIQLIKFFWGLCILKAAPQDLPASDFLLGLMLLAYFLTSMVVAVLQWPLPQAMLAALLDTTLLSVLCFVLLWARLLSARFLQTLTALAGSGALLGWIAVPVIAWQKVTGTVLAGLAIVPSFLLWMWMIWNVVVVGHILRHALSTTFALGVGLAGVYAYITFQLIRIFLPHN